MCVCVRSDLLNLLGHHRFATTAFNSLLYSTLRFQKRHQRSIRNCIRSSIWYNRKYACVFVWALAFFGFFCFVFGFLVFLVMGGFHVGSPSSPRRSWSSRLNTAEPKAAVLSTTCVCKHVWVCVSVHICFRLTKLRPYRDKYLQDKRYWSDSEDL